MTGLAAKVRALPPERQSEMAGELGTVTCEGRPLSRFNCVYLLIQGGSSYPLAMVGGFRQWKKAGRSVRKGETAAGYIFVPLTRKGKDRDPGDDDAVFFRLVPVFDVTQTDAVA